MLCLHKKLRYDQFSFVHGGTKGQGEGDKQARGGGQRGGRGTNRGGRGGQMGREGETKGEGNKQGTSGPGCLYLTATRCLP